MFRPLFISSLLASVAFLAAASASAAPEDGTRFKAWVANCEIIGKGEDQSEICNLNQVFTAGEPARPLLRVAVTYLPGDDKPYMILTMPLGMALPAGVELQIDAGEKQRIPVNTCLPDGCRAGGAIGQAMVDGMKKGKELKVSFADMSGQGVTIPVSLSGFTAGLAALR